MTDQIEPTQADRDAGKNYISPDLAEVSGIVAEMHTKWMRREELMLREGGFDLIEGMANLLDEIVDAVPALQRKLWAVIASAPDRQSEYARGLEDAAKVADRAKRSCASDEAYIAEEIASTIRNLKPR